MASAILNAISSGFPAGTVLNHIIQHHPTYARRIRQAQAAGYTAQSILKKIDNNTEDDEEQYLTEHERTQKRDSQQKKKAALQAVGALGTAGALGAAAYGYSQRNRAIRPSEILPPQQGPNPPGGGGGLPSPNSPRGIGYQPKAQKNTQPPKSPPQGPNPPQPQTQPTNQTQKSPQSNVDLVRNIKEDTRIENVLNGVEDIGTAIQVLKQVMPKGKISILEKAEGGLEQVVMDYAQHLQNNTPQVKENSSIQQMQNQSSPSEIPQMISKENENTPEQPLQNGENSLQNIEKQEIKNIDDRVRQAAFDKEHEPITQKRELRKESFYVPNYKHSGEDEKEFQERKFYYDVINRGAKAIVEGKSFLDFLPTSKDASKYLSTARDVLLFISGTPNVYDPLLDDEEKEELTTSLLESGKMRSPGMAPTKGERNIYGAQLTPNLIWNLLLSIEPKLATMKKPVSVKGYKMSPGKTMGTSEIRRSLTHALYGVLSGKTMSSELSDKISKISKATSGLDTIVRAAKEGNRRKMDEQMEKLMDDEYFSSVMNAYEDELESNRFTAEEMAQDTKMAASIKASATRKKNKKEKNED